jgi:Flp pilus assembly pilin Flp
MYAIVFLLTGYMWMSGQISFEQSLMLTVIACVMLGFVNGLKQAVLTKKTKTKSGFQEQRLK